MIKMLKKNAEKYGFKAGDKIIGFNNREVANGAELEKEMKKAKIGDEVTLRVLRQNSELDIIAKTIYRVLDQTVRDI